MELGIDIMQKINNSLWKDKEKNGNIWKIPMKHYLLRM